MAASPIMYFRNYDSFDTTMTTISAASGVPTVDSLGWSAPSGYQFKEWNSQRDGSGTSYNPGDNVDTDTELYVIWEEESHEVQIIYNNSTIGSMDNSGTVLLQTSGKYCEGNITVSYTRYFPNLQSKQVSPTTSSQTVLPDSGYDGLSQVTVGAISPTKSAQTYTPTTTDQTIASGRWLTGTQTIKGDANLVASNIASGVSIFGVTGTHSGGGSNEDLNKIITRTITSVTNSEVGYVGAYAFASCTSLTTASFPSCQVINSSAFFSCSKLTTISFPSCSSIGNSAFYYCYKLTTIELPVCKTVGSYAFGNCYSLTTASFPSCVSLYNYAFVNCYNLTSLYLTGSSVAGLINSTAFNSTPIAGYTTSTGGVYGSIFVPSSLYNTYISSTNWVYFSSRFVSV